MTVTWRDLIVYILQNNLEDQEVLNPNLCVTDDEAAVNLGVGVETIRAWYNLGRIAGFKINDQLYIFKTKFYL